MNLVMDDVEELLHNPANGETTDQRRSLGLAVLRGTNLTLISPVDGFEMIEKYVASTKSNYQSLCASGIVRSWGFGTWSDSVRAQHN